jgi:hypothetical protein
MISFNAKGLKNKNSMIDFLALVVESQQASLETHRTRREIHNTHNVRYGYQCAIISYFRWLLEWSSGCVNKITLMVNNACCLLLVAVSNRSIINLPKGI